MLTLKGDDYMRFNCYNFTIDEIKNLDADSFLIGNKYVRTNRVFSKKKR